MLVAGRILPAGWANVVATAAGTVPSFELNRRWVWNKTGRRSFARRDRPVLGAVVPRAGPVDADRDLDGRWADHAAVSSLDADARWWRAPT